MPMPMSSQTPAPLPWYDDRIKEIRSEGPSPWAPADDVPTPWDDDPDPNAYDTPRKIYAYLDTRVWKQDTAKKAAAIIVYHCLRGLKSNTMFIGPTGCGKTHIWRMLHEIFPDKIEIVDGSNLTQDGWKGDKKWADLLRFPAALSGDPAILVLDECDKMLSPRYTSHGENVAHGIQSEGLTIIEGTTVDVKDGPVTRQIDTSRISFVLCGAFSAKAHDIAAQANHNPIGFGQERNAALVQPYGRPMDEQDLLDFGVMPEFLGRIQRIVHLEPMTADDYYNMTGSSGGVLSRIGQQYGADIRLTPQKRRELAEMAYATGLGVRGMEGRIRRLVDDAMFDDPMQKRFEF